MKMVKLKTVKEEKAAEIRTLDPEAVWRPKWP